MQKITLDFRMNGNELLLNYEMRTTKCSWGIFDISGVEISSGALSGRPPHRIPLSTLSPDIYQLCVIDGDSMINSRFRVD